MNEPLGLFSEWRLRQCADTLRQAKEMEQWPEELEITEMNEPRERTIFNVPEMMREYVRETPNVAKLLFDAYQRIESLETELSSLRDRVERLEPEDEREKAESD